jgi:hypothetical protein
MIGQALKSDHNGEVVETLVINGKRWRICGKDGKSNAQFVEWYGITKEYGKHYLRVQSYVNENDDTQRKIKSRDHL